MTESRTPRALRINRIWGAFTGILHGDRLGLPWEMMTPKEISERTSGRGVTGVVQIPANHAFREVAGLPFGSTSDDWGLTAATIRGIISHGRHLEDPRLRLVLAREFADEFRRCGIGYGRGTKSSILAMDAWLAGDVECGRSPLEPVPFQEGVGSGNGVAMRIAPAAIAASFSSYMLDEIILPLGQMTHGDMRASIAAYALALCYHHISTGMRMPVETAAARFKEEFESGVIRLTALREREHGVTSEVSDALRKLLVPEVTASNESLRRAVGTSVLAWESVPYAIGVFLRNMRDPQAAILEAVNGGGDTDSIGSMVGGLSGLLHGYEALPEDWKAGDGTARVLTLAERFYTVCTTRP